MPPNIIIIVVVVVVVVIIIIFIALSVAVLAQGMNLPRQDAALAPAERPTMLGMECSAESQRLR